MSASTVKGAGNKSEPIIVITDKDRKYSSGIPQSIVIYSLEISLGSKMYIVTFKSVFIHYEMGNNLF